ncbi:MAG: Asp-tRNA(Asn)/Glu-tRNA(Gln) amidotransferase subunit GatC [Thermodesulfobacteriota bacterium]|nr:MAG: Asp-tRNA(Asn)/Glu-tRNA(Gln) amidotransferase subunit GatC [Thermodesulfobacteriota bacterium]
MSITEKDVLHVAELARLALTDKEKELYTVQLKRILGYVVKLSELDTKGVEPTTHTVPPRTAFREDRVLQSLTSEEALRNAPSSERGCFKVPQIIE